MKVNVLIIGAGVVGSSIARELSRFDLTVAVCDKASDVCEGTSKANSGIVHAGFDAIPGTRKAHFNVLGSRRMESLSHELDFPYKRNGSIVLSFSEEDHGKLEELLKRGEKNGVEGLKILTGDAIREMEPAISDDVVEALFAPTGGIVCPFGLTIAMAENACVNGVKFYLNTEVMSIAKDGNGFEVTTSGETFHADVVVNAAGVYADKFHNMLCEDKIKITARKGEYCLYDKKVGNLVSSTIFQLPGEYGKGVLVTPTVHGNLLLGPTAVDSEDKEAVNTTEAGLESLQKTASHSVKTIPYRSVITSFAGMRAHPENDDFLVGETCVRGFFEAAGIESPGLSAAPAIGEYLASEVAGYLKAPKKENFKSNRKGIPNIALASNEEKQRLISGNPLYANVICRCELVTEGEIVDAIKRPLGATTLDGVKRRTRAGMGRCQSGFCSPKTVEILARELGVPMTEITKHGKGSEFLSEHKSN
ncbi:MAG: NAD(P)/FAD-dependent oxidoreductase [Lachnospiraceae bacterium]|nr:NAD(P)/FAD-dependent oxidoreductase [Lachnospiraceae bacterium]